MQKEVLGGWEPSERYPDPAITSLDPSFLKYRVFNASIERLATGMRWSEGPVWFGDARCLLWSDIPNNRMMQWDETTGRTSVFRFPSNYSNGNTRDRQGRLVTCEHDSRRVTRTEYDGTITVLIDKFDGKTAQLAERRRRQVRRLDLVHRSAARHLRQLRGASRDPGTADQCLSPRSEDRARDRRGRRHQAERPVLLAGRAQDVHRRLLRPAARDPRL